MKKQKVFKPTCPWIKKDMAAAKRALNAWYFLGSAAFGDPCIVTPYLSFSPMAKKYKAKHNDLVLYGAALGQKRKQLPVDLTGWQGRASWNGDLGAVTFVKLDQPSTTVTVPLRFLEWPPDVAAEPMKEAA
jgi:hypothetical protein